MAVVGAGALLEHGANEEAGTGHGHAAPDVVARRGGVADAADAGTNDDDARNEGPSAQC